MTGPFVPVGILNPIRAVVGIPHYRFNLFVECSSKAELHKSLSSRRGEQLCRWDTGSAKYHLTVHEDCAPFKATSAM
jgi:hypothetical protein